MKHILETMKRTCLLAFLIALLFPLTIFGQEEQNAEFLQVKPNTAQNGIVIKTASVDFSTNLITIKGENFGSTTPIVKIGGDQLIVKSFDPNTQTIVAFLPGVLNPAAYLLTVSTGNGANLTTDSNIT